MATTARPKCKVCGKRHNPAWEKVQRALKPYVIITNNKEKGTATLQCPRKDCEGKFQVVVEDFKRLPDKTRPCPYCFRTSLVPGRKAHVAREE